MVKALSNIFSIPELRRKIVITFSLLVVYRIGTFIPTPGIDPVALSKLLEQFTSKVGTSFIGLINLFTGGALGRSSIFALGIMPYISASIIMQLLTAIVPSLEKLAHEGKSGHEKINQYTRYLTVALCLIQGLMLARWLESLKTADNQLIVANPGLAFKLITTLTITCGTIFIMWLGEQIQERGIGNGISLIITTSIISRFPSAVFNIWLLFSPFDPSKRTLSPLKLVFLIIIWLTIIMTVVFFTQAQRRIPIQYARRVVGRRVYGGQMTFLPIRVDMAGVIAIIFAQSVLLFPMTIANFFPQLPPFLGFMKYLNPDRLFYNVVYVVLLFFFMYFYTAMVFNPIEIANNLKRYGGFIPGVRPGIKTAEYIDFVATRIVFIGSVYIGFIAVFPQIIVKLFGVPRGAVSSFFGGTTILIMVGVVLDTMRQIESQLLLRHYEGFIKGKTLKGRR